MYFMGKLFPYDRDLPQIGFAGTEGGDGDSAAALLAGSQGTLQTLAAATGDWNGAAAGTSADWNFPGQGAQDGWGDAATTTATRDWGASAPDPAGVWATTTATTANEQGP